MNEKFLEQFYENVVLPRYKSVITFGKITWIDHGKIDLDAWAHYFRISGDKKEYALLYEDFPDGAYFKDGMSHEVVKCGDETSIKLGFNNDNFEIENILGWYTLYREK